MAVQRIYHWKHGWIPLDHYAALEKDHGRPSTVKLQTGALERAKARQAASKAQQAAKRAQADAAHVTSTQKGGFRFTKVDGYPDVTFKEVLELDTRPPEQYREVAKVTSDLMAKYPKAFADDKLQLRFSNELGEHVSADTGIDPPNLVRLNVDMWDQPGKTMATVADMRSWHWGVFAEAPDLETYRRDVITHEIGHVLHARDEAANRDNGEFTQFNIARGEVDKFADEPVTLRTMGYKHDSAETRDFPLDQPIPRWMGDSLNKKSAYALTSKYEWFAEAFLDGTINGNQASESGKRAVALAAKVFGPGGAS